MARPLHVTSEIGQLKTVLLHRPGEELENLTPEYLPKLLFDDIPYLKQAQVEHDAFAQVLRDRGVEVLYLDKMATEALHNNAVKSQFINEILQASKQAERRITQALFDFLLNMDTHDMVCKVMAGIRKEEVMLPEQKPQLHEMLVSSYPFYLDPMPNLYFTRDTGAVIAHGLTINSMHWPARRRESILLKYIMEQHPRFVAHETPEWYERTDYFSIEGGDELVLSKEVVAIGVSERTTAEAIESVACKLFAHTDVRKVIAIEIPKSRAFMHLDTVFTMIDRGTFTIHPAIQDAGGKMNIFVLTPSESSAVPTITHYSDLTQVLKEALHLDELTLIECGAGDPISAAREQWNDGSNTLAIAPGVVITYNRNYVTNQALRNHGIEVIEIEGAELGRGRGGPRCMSMPLVREDIA